MWQKQANKTSEQTERISIYSIITLPILYSTSFVDNLILYISHKEFYPGILLSLKDIIVSAVAIVVCSITLFFLVKCNKKAFNITVGILITGVCYVYVLEGNLILITLDKAIISYRIT